MDYRKKNCHKDFINEANEWYALSGWSLRTEPLSSNRISLICGTIGIPRTAVIKYSTHGVNFIFSFEL